jgi:hypothetical protein
MLDILRPDLWFTKYVSPHNSLPLSPIFEETGFDSTNIFANLGSTFIYGMLLFLLYVLYTVFIMMKKC